ncbi:MAG: YidC/Oxa1 family membrane protein insertase [Defluviitaleaceae bacterium]|nr:YidC/Oxa1 family membrane protein insertase [Defluviitaleaceae bacterium]
MIDFTKATFISMTACAMEDTSRQLEPAGGFFRSITEPISVGFGWVIDAIFGGLLNVLGPANSLGIAIVLMTLIFRFVLLPLTLKSQKSMMKMRELKPELDKLKEKYGNNKDPEIMKKFQQEQSALMAKHGANPLMGCLPLLIQMPLFIGLNTVMRNSAVYIGNLRNEYEYLAAQLLEIPGLIGQDGVIQQIAIVPPGSESPSGLGTIIPYSWMDNLRQIAAEVPQAIATDANALRLYIDNHDLDAIVLGIPEHLARVISRFESADWYHVFNAITDDTQRGAIEYGVANLATIETFLGVSMVENSGIVIAVLTGISMFFSSWLMQQRTYDPNADERTAMMQKMMLFVMPVMIAFFTINLVAAVGIFWITGQIFQIAQDLIMLKKSGTKLRLPFVKEPEVVEVVPAKKKRK